MPAVKTKRISTLIETQLPSFITDEYELFSKFVQKYYEAQEVQGGTLDVISNLQKYADIDFYEKNILKQHDSLAGSITASDTTITVTDAQSFPKKNGYVRIDDEIIFYATRTDTELQECSRGVSGNTSLGDLYEASNFTSTDAAAHAAGQKVYNVSNLFLYALVKNFENQYLGSFPEKYLKGEVDKRTLIKNIQKFYKAKGTKSSIQFIFNTIVSKEANNKPEVYKPRDFTYKSSDSDWVSVFALKCKLVSGNPKNLIGKKIVQAATEEYGYADATVDNVKPAGTADGEAIYDIILAPETVNGEFFVSTKTELTQPLSGVASDGDRINAFSTLGWEKTGSVLIGTETITFSEKTATQFIIDERNPNNAIPHASGEFIYKPVTIAGSGVTLLTFGVVYNLQPSDSHPYSYPGDVVEISNPGFETDDPKITQVGSNQTRWILNSGTAPNVPTLPSVATSISQVATDVSAIFADDQYYYITSSSFPSHKILDGSTVNETVLDQKLLRIVRKVATRTTETYATPRRDVGVGLNGVLLYGYKDHSSIRFGKLEEIKVDLRGTGYSKAPFVLIDQVPNKARAVLNGQVVESIIVDTDDIFPKTPDILITSGRNADIRAVVTGGKVTSLVIENPGEFYSAPPLIQIRDRAGRGRFAEFEAIVNTDGNITGFNKLAEGNFYNQDTVIVDVIPIGSGASGIPLLKEWNFNRFKKLENELDTENGYIFQNYNNALEYGYGYVGNPLALRSALNDNLTGTNQETSTIVHSPIIGFAHDGNPIYGPYGYQNPLDSTSSTIRMTSSYSLNSARSNGPSITQYPLGTFNNDYTYTHKSGTLDQNNGRFCVTPEFPKGTYAYFLTIDSNQVPQFPYILGENFYSLPVDSNYNSNISQDDIPKNSKRFFQPGMPRNGEGVIAKIEEVKPGNVEKVNVVSSSDNFSINSQIYFDNRGTDGSDAEAIISSVKGKSVNYLESKENKVVKLTVVQNAYLFANDTLNQPSSSASGTIVGTVRNDNTIVLRNVNGTFDQTGTFSASIKTFTVLLDQRSSYTKGATLSLTDGVNAPIATAEVLEGTASQNTVQIKVLSGTWVVDNDYFIQSDDLFNTSGTRLVRLTSLSDGLEPFEVNQSVALIETATNHGLGIGDQVTIDINPDDTTKTKTYYLRKRLYQEATLIPPSKKTTINFTGIGRYEILNGGADYTAGTYTSVSLTGGSGTGATATFTVSNAGVVSGIQLQNAGTGYARGDYLTVADEDLVRSGASQSTARFTIYVGHVGFAAGATQVTVDDALGFANNDLIKIGEEILQIVSISGNNINVTRAQEETADVDHFDGQEVSLYKARYNFDANYAIFNTATTGYVQTYDPVTQKIKVVYDYGTLTTNASTVELSSSFFDSSTPRRLVAVKSSESVKYKFEFSEDNTTFTPNPNINIQEFYKYIFDTSHSSLTGTYFDISPSRNYNLITTEKQESTILPGNPGAFTDVKFGFGSRLADNNYQTKKGTDFANFYYFDKKNVVDSEGAFFKIITDPLQGRKTINYVTADRFVYDIPSEPLWDGSGSISYTTTGQFAIGGINDVSIINLGLNYRKPPVVIGVDPTESYRASATVLFDDASQTITGVNISNIGSNYVNPKVVVTKGDGSGVEFNIVVRNGEIFSITIANPGRGYTYAPEIIIVESEVKAFVESSSIGVPQSIKITNNGGAFHLDNTVSSTFSSNYTVSLTGNSYNFKVGEIVTQTLGGQEVCRAKVSEFRKGTNLLKIREVRGIIRQNVPIVGAVTKSGGTVKTIFVTTLDEKVTSFYDNLGYYTSDKGRLGVSNQKLTDSYFYQDYSYVVKSKTPIDQWRELIKSTTHPAGFQLFGQVDVESSASTEMPVEVPKASHFSVIQLWDPDKNKITVESTKQVTTQSIQSVQNQRIRKAQGTAATSEFNFNEVRAFEFTLAAPFDGYYDTDGRLQGTTSFQILNDLGVPFFPASEKGLIVTLDGVLQEPGVSYNIAGDRIVFSAPPLGPGNKLTGDGGEVTPYKGVTFYGKVFQFKDAQYNTRYLRKIRNIFQRGGTWIDSANQIERNVGFIVNETIGYAKATYPTLDWSTKQDDYEANIRSILDAYQHDLRFGGNVKTINYTSVFNTNSDYLYIQNNRTESTGIFAYASRLAKLAIRNWDYTDIGISYVQGSRQMTVTSTENIAVGMFVSSGRAYPSGTKIVSIDSDTQITLNNVALANSGGSGGVPAGTTLLDGTATTGTIATSTGAVNPGDTFSVPPGVTVTVATSFSGNDQATFSWSGINNGTFYDAGNLIAANRADIISQSLTWAQAQYPSLNWGSYATKCGRDIGLIIDAYVYHLKFGGNEKIVTAAQLYYRKNDYPYGEELYYISGQLTETVATFAYARDLMIAAMKNQGAVTDPNVLVDSISPVCAEVESTLNTYHSILDTILTEGRGLVEKTPQNPNKAGNWTSDLTYSNYNILGDPLLPAQECNTVISAVDSLYDNLADVLQRETVTKSLPDYIDGETKEFELYWDDNTVVNTEEDEDLFLTLNAVLQRPKFTDGYPLEDSYVIDRTVIPNKIKFDVAPIWDQDLGAKTIGEPSSVEKVAGIGVGNYKRLTIDYDLVNGVRNGPFLILDVLDYTVQNIEAEDNLYVFLDGVLQRKGYSYTISGPNITFNVPIKKEMKIDMRYLYGRDVGQILNIYDFAPDSYFARGTFTFDTTVADDLLRYDWMGDAIGSPIHVWQQRANGTYNVLGEMTAAIRNGNTVSFSLKGQNAEIEAGLDYFFVPRGYYDRQFIILDADISNASLVYNTDDVGRKLLLDDNGLWSGTAYGKTYKPPFVSLSNNDQIRVEGEEGFRRVKKLPTVSTSKDGRPGEQLSDDIFGAVSIETYTGVTRGEGLSVVATVENGSVVSLSWNQRSYDPITQPTAYQYYTPPVLKFIPENGQGGGARANVLVSKGQVISVDLIDGGSGYTEAPKVITTRRFDVLSERGIGVSLINVGVNPFVQTGGMIASSVISEIEESGLSGLTSIASVTFGELNEASINIERDFDLKEVEVFSTGGALDPQRDYVEIAYNNNPSADSVIAGTLDYEATVVSAEIQDIVSLNSISTVSRAITQTQQIEIPNNAISNVNFFETAAYLDLDFNIGDSIAYIPDTTKFDKQGLLLIGDEIVYYNRKLSDRFLNILRNRKGTTEQNWVAGTYLRQIPEFVSVAAVGVVTIESESDVSMASGGATSIAFERNTQREISSPADFSITREAFEVVVTPPPGGVVDRYQESAFINDPLQQRNGNEVDLDDINGVYYVAVRSGAPDIAIRNSTSGELDYIGSYEVTNVGHTLSHYNNIFDDGANGVSGITLQEFDFYFADITLDDFIERGDSSFAKSGTRFNLMPPSIQNPVTISASTGGLAGTINAQNTAGFPSTGYAFTSNGSVFQYTGKTATSFTGVTLTRGPNSINTTHEIIPFTIS